MAIAPDAFSALQDIALDFEALANAASSLSMASPWLSTPSPYAFHDFSLHFSFTEAPSLSANFTGPPDALIFPNTDQQLAIAGARLYGTDRFFRSSPCSR